MKKLISLLLLLPILAFGQADPNYFHILDNTQINVSGGTISGAAISGGTIAASTVINATTNGRLDNSTLVATDGFVGQQISGATATIPYSNVTGGTYNQASLGTGLAVAALTSGGAVTSVVAVASGGTGYAVGDVLVLPMGNSDARIRVTSVSGGVVQPGGVAVVYGGTGYTGSFQTTAQEVPPGHRAIVLTGTLTSNLTYIIPAGAYLTASRETEFVNNTTGAFTITVFLSNGAGGTAGNGVVLPQGTNNSTAMSIYTDGVNDVWPAVSASLAPVHTQQEIDKSYTFSTPTTGQTVTLATGTETAIIAPAGTLAALTVALPGCTAAYDGSLARFSSSQIITSLTVSATSGSVVDAPTTLAVGGGAGYLCRGSNTSWYRLY